MYYWLSCIRPKKSRYPNDAHLWMMPNLVGTARTISLSCNSNVSFESGVTLKSFSLPIEVIKAPLIRRLGCWGNSVLDRLTYFLELTRNKVLVRQGRYLRDHRRHGNESFSHNTDRLQLKNQTFMIKCQRHLKFRDKPLSPLSKPDSISGTDINNASFQLSLWKTFN